MPKKYLLYIHDSERFDKLDQRGQKSSLINDLLEQHWKTEDLAAKAKKNLNGMVSGGQGLAVATRPKIIKTPTEAKVAVAQTVETCPHGYAKGSCKKAGCNRRFTALEAVK